MAPSDRIKTELAASLNRDLTTEEQYLKNAIDTLKVRAPGSRPLESTWATLRSFERVVGLLYRFREVSSNQDPNRLYHEDVVAEVSHRMLFSAPRANSDAGPSFTQNYRRIWKEDFSLFVFCVVLFLASCLVGWFFTYRRPEYALVLMPQNMAELILDKEQWFARIAENPFAHGAAIAINNIKVCIYAFSLGLLAGLGGLGIVSFNGIFFGAIVGYAAANDFADPLHDFVVGHGPLELSIIVASGFASLQYGRAFYLRPWSEFPKNLRLGAGRAFTVLLGIIPWLVLAASIEGFVSPFHYLSYWSKLTLGIIVAAGFWIWTLWPESAES